MILPSSGYKNKLQLSLQFFIGYALIQIPDLLITLYDRHWKKRISLTDPNTMSYKTNIHKSLIEFGNHHLNQTKYRPTSEFGTKPEGNKLGSNWPDTNRTNITKAVLNISGQMQSLNK